MAQRRGRMRRTIMCLSLISGAGHVGVGSAAAQWAPDTLVLENVVRMARDANPKLAAARLRADAASERVTPAGTLPDPQLTFGLMNRPVDGFGTTEPMTMNQIQLMQRFPWPGKLAFSEERARSLALAGALEADNVEVQLVSRVKEQYYELAYMDRAIAIMERTRDLLRDFFEVSRARYEVGDGLQQDVLRAQVAVAGMREDIIVMEQQRVAMAARLNALLGRAATASVGALELPESEGPLPEVDALLALAVAGRPALLASQERARAAQWGYRAARRQLYPDFTVSLGYGQRPQFGDMATLMIGVSVPLWAGARQLPLRREMAAMQASEDAMARDLYNETFAELTALRAQAMRARELSRLYVTSILPQARAAVESALSAYRVGQLEYGTLVENEMTVNRYEVELVRLTAQYHQAVARINALLGSTEEQP
jgi:outer membrane protein TolC